MESRNIRMFFNDRRFKRNWSLRTETTRPLVAFRLVYESTFMTISIENVRTPPWAKTNVYESLTVSLWKLLRHYLELHGLKHQILFFKKGDLFLTSFEKLFHRTLWTLLKLSAGWPERTMILTATW